MSMLFCFAVGLFVGIFFIGAVVAFINKDICFDCPYKNYYFKRYSRI